MTDAAAACRLLDAFETGRVDPAAFDHRAHLCVAHALLRRHRFTVAADWMSAGLRRLLDRVGRPDAYHETITIAFLAFLALVAERLDDPTPGFDDFVARHPLLLDRNAVADRYGAERLASPVARATFVLP